MTIKEYVINKKLEIKNQVSSLKVVPHFVIIQINEDEASNAYVRGKMKDADEVGILCTLIKLPIDTSEEELLSKIDEVNKDKSIHGLIVQMPLPNHINEEKVKLAVDPKKDIDGFHPLSLLDPCTPKGIINYLKDEHYQILGKNAVVIGRSNIVGKPMSVLLSQKGWDCTVTLCHSKTKNLETVCASADILIAALGTPGFVKANMVKEGAVVIDVGTTRVTDATRERGWRLCGDVMFDEVSPKCSYITPVPGGVGPMTICSLMINTLQAAKGKKA